MNFDVELIERDRQILEMIAANPGITAVQIRRKLGITVQALKNSMARLSGVMQLVRFRTSRYDRIKTSAYWLDEAAPEDAHFRMKKGNMGPTTYTIESWQKVLKESVDKSEFLQTPVAQVFGLVDASQASIRLAANTGSYFHRISA